jgi:hypothetical protein
MNSAACADISIRILSQCVLVLLLIQGVEEVCLDIF